MHSDSLGKKGVGGDITGEQTTHYEKPLFSSPLPSDY